MTEAKREAIYGPEPWQRSGGVAWSHWDLWFCLVAHLDHDGDLVALADASGTSTASTATATRRPSSATSTTSPIGWPPPAWTPARWRLAPATMGR